LTLKKTATQESGGNAPAFLFFQGIFSPMGGHSVPPAWESIPSFVLKTSRSANARRQFIERWQGKHRRSRTQWKSERTVAQYG
jgi:hypothetical protein